MFGLRSKLTIVIVLVLAFGAVQCASACTLASCKAESAPPCHKHRQTVSQHSCEQVFVRPATQVFGQLNVALDQRVRAAGPLDSAYFSPPLVLYNAPPGCVYLSLAVLRI